MCEGGGGSVNYFSQSCKDVILPNNYTHSFSTKSAMWPKYIHVFFTTLVKTNICLIFSHWCICLTALSHV